MCLSSGSQGPQPTHFHMRVTLAGRSFPCYSSQVGTVGAEEEAPNSSGAQLSPSAFFTWRFGEAELNHLDLLFGCCRCSLPLLSCIAQPRACMETPTHTGPMASAWLLSIHRGRSRSRVHSVLFLYFDFLDEGSVKTISHPSLLIPSTPCNLQAGIYWVTSPNCKRQCDT